MRGDWLGELKLHGLCGADPEPPPGDPTPPAGASDGGSGNVEAEQAIAYAQQLGIRTAVETAKGADGQPLAWQDVDTVLALLDRSKIGVDFATGTVSGVSEQLDALAKGKPFLLRQTAPTAPPSSYGTPPSGGLSGHHERRTSASDYAREHPGVYGDALRRLAGAATD